MLTFLVYLSLTRLGLPLCDFVGGKFGGFSCAVCTARFCLAAALAKN
jgi:hypothetical protein